MMCSLNLRVGKTEPVKCHIVLLIELISNPLLQLPNILINYPIYPKRIDKTRITLLLKFTSLLGNKNLNNETEWNISN